MPVDRQRTHDIVVDGYRYALWQNQRAYRRDNHPIAAVDSDTRSSLLSKPMRLRNAFNA